MTFANTFGLMLLSDSVRIIVVSKITIAIQMMVNL